MFKKLFVIAGIALAVGFVVKGSSFMNDLSSGVQKARAWVDKRRTHDPLKSEESFNREVEKLRQEAEQLNDDIEAKKRELATEIVEVRELRQATAALRTQVDNEKVALQAKGKEIKDATTQITYGGFSISADEAKARLERDVKIHVRRKATLGNMEKTLTSREYNVEMLSQQLDGLVNKKQEMVTEIDAIVAEYNALKLKDIESNFTRGDDSRLTHIKESLAKLRKQIAVKTEMQKLSPVGHDDLTHKLSTSKSVDEILSEIGK